MTIWVCRTGAGGQFENVFYENKAVYLTREGFDFNVSLASKKEIINKLSEMMPTAARQTISNAWSQVNIFAHRMADGDVVLVPKKGTTQIGVGIIDGDYEYIPSKPFPYQHRRKVEFICRDIETCRFPQDIRYSLGAFRSIFSIRQEERLLNALMRELMSSNLEMTFPPIYIGIIKSEHYDTKTFVKASSKEEAIEKVLSRYKDCIDMVVQKENISIQSFTDLFK